MDSKDFVKELLEELEPNRRAHADITEQFFSLPRSKNQTVALLMDRCYRELDGAIKVGQQVPLFMHVDRDIFQMITKQVADEARHYHLLASILEDLLGHPLEAADIKPVPLTLEQNKAMYDEHGKDVVERFASMGLGAEYLSAAVNEVFIARAEPAIATAYKKINRDENFHGNIGKLGLERYATTPEKQAKARKAALHTAELHLRAYDQLFATVRAME